MENLHKSTLSNLCEDVLLMISDLLHLQCSEGETPIKNLSMVNRRLRNIVSPCLFKSLCINRPLSQLCSTPLIYQHATSLKIDMFGSMWWWCSGAYVSSKDALQLFACVQEMGKLKRLEVTMMKRNLDMFMSAFEEVEDARTFLLPGIETLVVTSAAAFLGSHCPYLKKLVIEDASSCTIEAYIDIASQLTPLHSQLKGGQWAYLQLTHFETTAYWSIQEIAAFMPIVPQLQHLNMRSYAFCYRTPVAAIMQLLGCGLRDLKTLKLNKVGNLGMGFRAVYKRIIQSCTPAQRKTLWLQNEAQKVEAENDVVRLAFTNIGSLEECWLGDKRIARRLTDSSHDHRLSWIWQRERETLFDNLPGSEWASYRAERAAVIVCSEICT